VAQDRLNRLVVDPESVEIRREPAAKGCHQRQVSECIARTGWM
jgi:hypothetical protein